MRILAIGFLVALAAQPTASTGGSSPVTPSVTATYLGYGAPNGAWTLELLVLWRGAPGWPLGGAGSGGAMGGVVTQFVMINGRTMGVQYDPQTRQVRLDTQVVDLGESNVVLIDEVDAATGPKIFGTARIQPAVVPPSAEPIVALIGRSPDLLEFAQCGVPLPDSQMQQLMEMRCAVLRGEIAPGGPNMPTPIPQQK